jgi:hypothetical protein
MLKQLSQVEIFHLNAAVLKDSKVANKLQTNASLTMNTQQLLSCLVLVPEGHDNRKNMLHKARFFEGASFSA